MIATKPEFSTKRIRCKRCGKKAFAPFLGIDGGYCHFCQNTDKPIDMTVPVLTEDKTIPDIRRLELNLFDKLLDAKHSKFVKYFCSIFDSGFSDHCINHFGMRSDYYGNAVFPYWNYEGELINVKTIAYDDYGHRKKDYPPLFGINIRDNKGNISFRPLSRKNGYTQCLFNEHALNPNISNRVFNYNIKYDSSTPVVLVEAEKSVVIASYYMPEYIWVASGGISGLTDEKSKHLIGRNVKVFFDNEDVAQLRANKVMNKLINRGINATVSNPFNFEDYPKGYDIADYLVAFYSGREK